MDTKSIVNILTTKNNSNRNWIIFVAILIILFSIRECHNQNLTDNLVKNITNYSDTVKFEKLKNGALVSTNASLQLQTQDQLRTMASNINDTVKQMLKKFKSLTNVTYVTNKFYAGGDTIRLETPIPCDFKPFKVRRGTDTDTSYKFVGTIGKDFFSIDTIGFKDHQTLVFGRKKTGFLKSDYVVDINHSNPYLVTTNIKDYKYTPKKEWYEKTWVHMVAGAIIETGIRQGVQTYINRH